MNAYYDTVEIQFTVIISLFGMAFFFVHMEKYRENTTLMDLLVLIEINFVFIACFSCEL